MRRVKYWKPLPILAVICISLSEADDFKTINGKEYKNATITRVEPDGIVLKMKSGISKRYISSNCLKMFSNASITTRLRRTRLHVRSRRAPQTRVTNLFLDRNQL